MFFRTPRRVGRRTPVGSEGLPATRAHAAIAAVVFRARRFAASQSAGAPCRQTRAGQFGRFSASRTHASTTAAFFCTPRCVARRTPVGSEGLPASRAHVAIAAVVSRVTCPRGTSRRDLPRPRFAATQSARAPRRQTRAGRFGGFPAPCAHASTAAVVFRVTRPRGTSRRDLPRPALRRVPIRESAASPDARRSVRKFSRVAYPRVHSRHGFPRHAPARHQPP